MKKNLPPLPDFYETIAWQNQKLVCGVDEVGRGCLAGPVVIGAVILPTACDYPFKDSKKMTASQREKACAWIKEHAAWSIAFADHNTIQERNIYQATLQAMRAAVLMMATRHTTEFSNVAFITVDAMPLTLPALPGHPPIASFIKGEDHSRSIAAASIVAKVTRDALLQKMAPLFPLYTFAADKSYATPSHCKTLKEKSATFIHRPAFVATVRNRQPKDRHEI